jgi:hypothetical protein
LLEFIKKGDLKKEKRSMQKVARQHALLRLQGGQDRAFMFAETAEFQRTLSEACNSFSKRLGQGWIGGAGKCDSNRSFSFQKMTSQNLAYVRRIQSNLHWRAIPSSMPTPLQAATKERLAKKQENELK